MVLPGVMTLQNDVASSGETPAASCAIGPVKNMNLGMTLTRFDFTFHDLLAPPPNAPQEHFLRNQHLQRDNRTSRPQKRFILRLGPTSDPHIP